MTGPKEFTIEIRREGVKFVRSMGESDFRASSLDYQPWRVHPCYVGTINEHHSPQFVHVMISGFPRRLKQVKEPFSLQF